MKTTKYPGIDYSHGLANCDKTNGIRYGVISSHSLNPDVINDIISEGSDYGPATCGKCGNTAIDSNEVEDSIRDEDWFERQDYSCLECKRTFWSDEAFAEEPLGWNYESDGYVLSDCLSNDVFVLKSPFYTYAQFCSPCVPGAGNLDSPLATLGESPKVYCLGEDFFEDGIVPYRIFRVSDDSELPRTIRLHCDQCSANSINGVFCHEHGCPNIKARYDESSETWIAQYTCFDCGYKHDLGETCNDEN